MNLSLRGKSARFFLVCCDGWHYEKVNSRTLSLAKWILKAKLQRKLIWESAHVLRKNVAWIKPPNLHYLLNIFYPIARRKVSPLCSRLYAFYLFTRIHYKNNKSFNWWKWTWNIFFSENRNVMSICKQLAESLIWKENDHIWPRLDSVWLFTHLKKPFLFICQVIYFTQWNVWFIQKNIKACSASPSNIFFRALTPVSVLLCNQ